MSKQQDMYVISGTLWFVHCHIKSQKLGKNAFPTFHYGRGSFLRSAFNTEFWTFLNTIQGQSYLPSRIRKGHPLPWPHTTLSNLCLHLLVTLICVSWDDWWAIPVNQSTDEWINQLINQSAIHSSRASENNNQSNWLIYDYDDEACLVNHRQTN